MFHRTRRTEFRGIGGSAWADIAAHGAFSTFAGIDRTSVLLSGSLALHGEGSRLDFTAQGDAHFFPGECALFARIDTPEGAQPLNVILRRNRATAQVRVHRRSAAIAQLQEGHTLLVAAAGEFQIGFPHARCEGRLSTEEGLIGTQAHGPCEARLLSDEGCLIQIDVGPVLSAPCRRGDRE